MKAAILIEDRYEVLEAWYPYLRLREEGIETVFVGPGKKKQYGSKEGYPAPEELKIESASVDDFDMVIVPGGYAPDMMRRTPAMIRFVREMFLAHKLVAAICHAGSVLVSAGILKGKTVTCFESVRDDVVNAGAAFRDQEVVIDDNLITSRNPFDLPAFCKAIVENARVTA